MDSGAFEVVLADGQHVVVRRIADGDAAAWTAYLDGVCGWKHSTDLDLQTVVSRYLCKRG